MIIKILLIFAYNLIIVKFYYKISNFINLFDYPDKNRKIHLQKIAPVGGFIIFTNLSLYFFLENNLIEDYILWFFAFLIFMIGFFDDKFKLNANLKLLLFIIFSYSVFKFNNNLAISQLSFSFLNHYISLGKLSLIFSIFSLVIFLNSFNMFDGINLQSGLYSIFIFTIFISKNYFTNFSIIMIIALFFFLYLNYKNICFLGDNGSLLIAFLISYIFISSSSENIFFADEILLIMLLPGLDLIRLFFLRLSKRKNPFSPDNDHFHHHLLKRIGLIRTNLLVLSIIIFPYFFARITNNFILFIILSILIYFFVLRYFKKKIFKDVAM